MLSVDPVTRALEDLARRVANHEDRVKRLETLEGASKFSPEGLGCLHFIERQVGDGVTNTVTFLDIPQVYRHLRLIYFGTTITDGYMRFNNDAGANYRSYYFRVQNSLVLSDGAGLGSNQGYLFRAYNLFNRSLGEALIYNYASRGSQALWWKCHNFGSSKVGEESDPMIVELAGGRWAVDDPVTRIDVLGLGGGAPVWETHSTFDLYGIC